MVRIAADSGGGEYVEGGESYSDDYPPGNLTIFGGAVIKDNTEATDAPSNVFLCKDSTSPRNPAYDARINI